MSLRIVVDMNLSPEWVPLLEQAGWSAIHWSTVGDPAADDTAIMSWATANEYIVFTHDLDFSAALALTHAESPSIVQVRSQKVLPEHIGSVVLSALKRYEQELAAGALVVVELTRNRVRILPLK